MTNYENIVQGTPEWHEMRYRKIGGTACKGLFVKSDTLLIELISKFLEDFDDDNEDSFVSADMQRGTELEPLARKELILYTGIEFKETGWIQSLENELLGISPDGISDDETAMCEIKCFGAKKHTEVLMTNSIPQENIHQCLHYFTVNPKLESLYFCAYRPENNLKPLFVKELKRDSLIDLGTKTKPNVLPVHAWVDMAKFEAEILKNKIEQEINKLKF